jgi:hypothetical protein
MRIATLLLSGLVLVGCHRCLLCRGVGASRSITAFLTADAPPVDSGRYPGPLRMLAAADPLSARTAPLRADAEFHEQVLRRLVRERISVKSPLEFQLMYAGHDSLNRQIVLRYFSRAADQTEFAGWQVQLVYALPALQPVHAYVQAVPLE